MSKRRRVLDENQLELDFEKIVDDYLEASESLTTAIHQPVAATQSEHDLADLLASVCKMAIRESRMSREQLVDAINEYFGRSDEGADADPPQCRKPLSIHMLNNYLSKPVEYPMPAVIVTAISCITDSLSPLQALADSAGAKVISGAEVWQMKLGKITEMKDEIRRLEKELKGKRL